ncbi:MAG: AraC family transcriptional regulator ligand-binding domain-containing protein, partial [Sneathiella sp.]
MEMDVLRLTHLVSALEIASGDSALVDQVLKKCGLNRGDAKEKDGAFTYKKETLFIREACDALADNTFGARAGLEWQNSSSLTGYIAKYSKDLRAAIENTAKLHDVANPAAGWSLKVSGNAASFEVAWKDESYARFHRHSEFVMFGALSQMRSVTQINFYPLEMRLDHEVGKSSAQFQKLAGFPVVFGAERPEIILSLSSLDLPVPTYDLRLREHLTQYGQKLLAERKKPQQDMRSKCEALLTASLPVRILGADEVAGS